MDSRINPLSDSLNPESTDLPYLRLLGGLTLEEEGVVLSGRAVQKRRLALLALLAAAPHRTASRDKLMGILWPDKDEDQARHLLSAAAYEIRKELGDAVLVTRGDDLTLDPAALTTDLDEFRAALERDELDRAAALYSGPFLDGFFLGQSPAFDHWVEEERASVAGDFRGALEQLAERHEERGELAEAVAAWRRLAAEDRYDSRIALRLLRALAAAGNRAGALQFARVHEALLQQEFGATPPPEFAALLETIRSAPATPATPAVPAAPAIPVAPDSATSSASPTPAASTAPATFSSTSMAPSVARRAGPSRVTEGQRQRRQRWNWLRLVGRSGSGSILRTGVVTAFFLVAVGLGAYLQRRAVPAVPPGTAIAVLPFAHGGGVDEAFADGLAEEILWLLGSVEGVRVPVWSASAAMRGLGAQEAARQLGMHHVLDGTVRRDEGMLRIRVWLSDAHGMQLWSERYDLPEDTEVFRTQDQIARSVLRALEVELGDAVAVAPRQGGTEDVVAYDNYLKGRHAWYKRTPLGFRQAVVYFGNAVARDPEYGRAYAGLADTYSLMGAYDYGIMPPDSAYRLALEAASRALRLAPELAEAHAAMAQVRFAYGRDWDGADEGYRRSIELNPRYAEAHHWYSGYLVAVGRGEEAMAMAARALALDTVSPVMHSNMARHLYYSGQYDAAEATFHRALAIDQAFIYAHLGLGLVLIQLDRPAEAVARFTHTLEIIGQPHPLTLALLGYALGRAGRVAESRDVLDRLEAIRAAGEFVPPEYPAIVHTGLGDFDEAVAGFERGYRAGSSAVTVLAVDPLGAPLRGHPGFERLLTVAAPPGALR